MPKPAPANVISSRRQVSKALTSVSSHFKLEKRKLSFRTKILQREKKENQFYCLQEEIGKEGARKKSRDTI